MKNWIITGSSTDDGGPLYLQASGDWSRRFDHGQVLDAESRCDAALERARGEQRLVCDPYAIEVHVDEVGRPTPTSLKQRIRAEGPTVSLVEASPSWRARSRSGRTRASA